MQSENLLSDFIVRSQMLIKDANNVTRCVAGILSCDNTPLIKSCFLLCL